MKFIAAELPGVVLLEPDVFTDERGWFMESFQSQRFQEGLSQLGLPSPRSFVQDNESNSRRGVLRGLQYQLPPHPQGKLVRVTQGAVFDVCVDVRRNSAHFGRWFGVELSAENRRQMWIPEGFAHGFVALQDDTRFHYKTTDVYARDCERAIVWNDAQLAIAWPQGLDLQVTAKDANAPRLTDADLFD